METPRWWGLQSDGGPFGPRRPTTSRRLRCPARLLLAACLALGGGVSRAWQPQAPLCSRLGCQVAEQSGEVGAGGLGRNRFPPPSVSNVLLMSCFA